MIANAFTHAVGKAEEVLASMSIPMALDDRDSLLKNAITSLNSKERITSLFSSPLHSAAAAAAAAAHLLSSSKTAQVSLIAFRWVQVVSQNSHLLAPIAVDAVLKVIDPATATNVDLRDIRVRFCRGDKERAGDFGRGEVVGGGF